MSDWSYVIRQEHVRAAVDKATAEELPQLERFLELVSELDALERSLPERVHKAQSDAGLERQEHSKAAREAISQSDDARRELDKQLTRRCHRADSAEGVVREILTIAKVDMKEANVLDNWISEDDPTKAIYSELYWKRRAFVDSLREFLLASK